MRNRILSIIAAITLALSGLAIGAPEAKADSGFEEICVAGYSGAIRVFPDYTTGSRRSVSLTPVSCTYVQYISRTRIYVTAGSYKYSGSSVCHTGMKYSDPANRDYNLIFTFGSAGC